VQQYSVDIQRELPRGMAVSVGYIGARGDDLSLGAADGGQLNINELDPSLLRLGSALLDAVPNPFFGNANAGALATAQTVQRRQLLRPFPQFGNVFILGATEGKSRYNAAVVKLTKRVAGWGGTFNYTYSVLKDNQFGQNNFYSRTPRALPLSSYDLDAEYGYSIIDVPHRLVLSPIVELPFGQGRKWLNTGGVADALVGGWSIAALMNFESGFPISVEQNTINTNTFGGTQRPNVVAGANPNTAGSREERFSNYIDPNAYTLAPAFTLGNAPRTDPNLRTPHRNNVDLSLAKDLHLKGSLRAQVKIEVTNLTNTVKVRGPEQRIGQATFGDILVQAGFMRITQAMFRLTF
jgi:hypothetical protein